MSKPYKDVYTYSIEKPEAFWAEVGEDIHWSKKWDRVLNDDDPPFYRWYCGGELNTAYNALDIHVEHGRGEQKALIYDSPVTNHKRQYTYRELQDEVALFAGVLASQGVNKGDRVIIYMPMVPEAVIAMLACARLGAIHSVVFGGFASNELAIRIDDATPKVVVSASCGIEPGRTVEYKPLLDEAMELANHSPSCCIILQREIGPCLLNKGQDLDWSELMAKATPHGCVAVASTDPLYILYTSGTTGEPKGVVRDNGGHAVALKWSMPNIYNSNPGDVYWAASDIGWVVGHSYIVYAPLLNGNTTVLYEGKPVGTPDAGAFWRVVSEYKVNCLFTAPTAFRAIKKEDPKGELIKDYDISSLRTLWLAGERTDPDTLLWAREKLKVPVIDHWWQTETGWAICANCWGIEPLPIKDGSPTKAAPGMDVRVLSPENNECAADEIGALVVKLPLPPGTFPTLWNARDRYVDTYFKEFPGFYKTADAGFIDADNYVYVMARTDDIINVAGHRLSTGAIEEVLAAHKDVAECAVIGVADKMKGQLPIGLLVLNTGVNRPHDQIVAEAVQLVRSRIGPIAAFKSATIVQRLPKTRSGKILRGTVRRIADNEPWKVPATIDDPTILDEIIDALKAIGYVSSTRDV